MVLRLTSDGNHMCVWIQLQHTFTSDGNHTCEDESSNGPDVREECEQYESAVDLVECHHPLLAIGRRGNLAIRMHIHIRRVYCMQFRFMPCSNSLGSLSISQPITTKRVGCEPPT